MSAPAIAVTSSKIRTFTGKLVDPLNIAAEDIDIRDIAHALSMQCRFSGHTKEFYSVAQHSVLVSHNVLAEHALWGLLHDASEAYLVDVPRPLKHCSDFGAAYRVAEGRVMRAICQRFGLRKEQPLDVKLADSRALWTEQRDLMNGAVMDGKDPFEKPISGLMPQSAEYDFLKRFEELTGGAQ